MMGSKKGHILPDPVPLRCGLVLIITCTHLARQPSETATPESSFTELSFTLCHSEALLPAALLVGVLSPLAAPDPPLKLSPHENFPGLFHPCGLSSREEERELRAAPTPAIRNFLTDQLQPPSFTHETKTFIEPQFCSGNYKQLHLLLFLPSRL